MRFYTSIKQSRKLLELGMKPDSCDFFYMRKNENEYKLVEGCSASIRDQLFSFRYEYEIPCWSVGRLLQFVKDTIQKEGQTWSMVCLKFFHDSEESNYELTFEGHYDCLDINDDNLTDAVVHLVEKVLSNDRLFT